MAVRAAFALLMSAVWWPTAEPVSAASIPTFDHVFVIVMENKSFNEIIGSSAAPYTNSLAASGALGTRYFGVAHPSLPNYLALTGGSTYGISSDCTTCWVSAPNIADSIESAGKSWKAYEESMPSPCFIGDSYPYAQKHDPFIYFNDIRNNASRCASHVVPYTQLTADLASTSTTPNFGFITPNMCSDMHDCSVATGDSWLRQHVPQILSSPAFTTQRSLLAITWDEDDFTTLNQVPLILLGRGVTAGFASATGFNHYSLLHTIESSLGLSTLTANDSGAGLMSDFFGLVGWLPLAGLATSGLAATSSGASAMDVFVRGTDQGLWYIAWNGSGWANWQPIGGVLTSSPGADSVGSQTSVFVRGTDDQLWTIGSNSGTFGRWTPLGGVLTSGPASDAWSGASLHIDVFVRGTDGALWHKWADNGTWYFWEPLGGKLASDPATVSSGPARIDVFVRGTDNQLWHRWFDHGAWYGWEALGGVLTSSPAVTSCAPGHLDVLVVGSDGQIWRKGYNGASWGGWQPLGGQGASGLTVTCPAGTGTLQMFAHTPDGAVVQNTATGS
jgi:hypothetical protein